MATHPSLLASLSSELTDLAHAAAPFVVSVAARSHRSASGVALGGNLILTADHAVERDRDIGITLDAATFEAVLIARDPATDLAVLRAEGLDLTAPPTAAPPPPGALVLSISRTGSGTLSTGLGVITSVGGPLRTGRGTVLPSIFRTDAALRPGTAGGALIDVHGQLVGITTPGLLRGLPVAIPAVDAFALARRLASKQPLGRGYLGLSVQPVTLAASQQAATTDDRGLLVFGIAPDGSAARAGLLVGDILMRFDVTTLRDLPDLQDQLGRLTPGDARAVTVLRGGVVHQLSITVGERPAA